MSNALHEWRRYLSSIQEFSTKPPSWVLPGLLPQGMVLIAGDPKTFKSLLSLFIVAALTEGKPWGDPRFKRHPVKKGSAVYFAAEQSGGRIRHIYESRVTKKPLPKGRVNYDFMVAKNPWEWQLDSPDGEKDFVKLARELKPTLLIVDPLVYFHSLDENDPQMVRPLVPLRQEVLKYGGTLLVVHHARKSNDQKVQARGASATPDWSRVRGTSALWGMADGGIMTSRLAAGTVNIITDFKDFTGSSWSWRPGSLERKAGRELDALHEEV